MCYLFNRCRKCVECITFKWFNGVIGILTICLNSVDHFKDAFSCLFIYLKNAEIGENVYNVLILNHLMEFNDLFLSDHFKDAFSGLVIYLTDAEIEENM